MHRIFRVKAYEAEHGPHFNEEHARKAVSKMENEDGTRGPHWSIEETTTLANQYGISLGNRFNRYDWFVALNMVYSDYYKVIINITNSNSTKHFVELAKAWINDKDIDEGKMWYYYIYVMCDKIRQAEAVYDEPLPPGQFPMPNQSRKRIVDITIQCNGETKKFTIPENKSVITDSALGLTISTDKQEIINIVRNQYNTYKQRKEAIAKCDEEMAKCQALLDKLGINDKPAKENDEIIALQKEVNELKSIIRKANQMVPPPMKEMLPQDMKNAMDKVGQ